MEANTAAIIRLAWCRRLGLADTALEGGPGLLTYQRDDAVVAVRLWSCTVLQGPSEVLRAAEQHPGRALGGRDLLDLVPAGRQRSARLSRSVVLAYADGYADAPGLDAALISDDPDALAAVERSCPPDDVVATSLAGTGQRYVLHDADETPVAAAGASEWQHLIGSLSVLVGMPYRHRGYGRLLGAAATNDLVDAGLVAEWQSPRDHPVSGLLARQLGYQPVGSVTTIDLEPSTA
jgi:hypothetical protein